jgi:hypothetical protein
MKKYPRTFHLPFSQEVHSDDKVMDETILEEMIKNKTIIVITEKLDGGNACLKEEGVFARSHSGVTNHETFDYIKNKHYYPNKHLINNGLKIFGENMYGIHSIEYTNLKDYFYVFNMVVDGNFISFTEVEEKTKTFNMQLVPVVYKGIIKSKKWLEEFMKKELEKASELGGQREGFVIRNQLSFPEEDFVKNVFKYVRKNHVQTDEHWSKNWKKAKLNKE